MFQALQKEMEELRQKNKEEEATRQKNEKEMWILKEQNEEMRRQLADPVHGTDFSP